MPNKAPDINYLLHGKRHRKKTFKAAANMSPNPKKKNKGAARLAKTTPAYKQLVLLFDNKEIDPDARPKDVYEGKYADIFQKHKLDSFRSLFNRLKAEKGVLLRAKTGTKQTVAEGIAAAQAGSEDKMQNLMAAAAENQPPPPEDEAEAADEAFVTPAAGLPKKDEFKPLPWRPHFLAGVVEDSAATRDEYFVAVNLPSGMEDPIFWQPSVTEADEYRLECKAHPTMQDTEVLCLALPEQWSDIKKANTAKAINAALKEQCDGIRRQVWYDFSHKLPFKCDTKLIVNQPIKFNGCHYLYVQMQAVQTDGWNLENKPSVLKDYSNMKMPAKKFF